MEPFTMMLGYGLVNSLSQLVVRPIADKLGASGRQQEIKYQMETKHALDLAAVRLNKQIELDNQKDIQAYCHNFRMQEAQGQFERQLQMWQIGKFNDQMWPLLTPYDHPSLRPMYVMGQSAPVNIFLAKTDPRSPFSSFVQPDLKNRLSNFLQTSYVNDPQQLHPCICRIGDWKDGFQDAAFINALWYGMQGQPTIVVNPIQSEFGEILDLNVSIWGLGETGIIPKTQNVLTGSFASAIGRIKRDKTIKWRDCGLPIDSKEMLHNINILKQEDKMISEGHGDYIDKLLIQYQLPKEIQTEVITEFSGEYNHLISCITGMYADIYHLIEYGAQPYMPIAMNQYNQMTGNTYQIPDIAIQHYRKALTNMTCTNYLQDKLPYAFLGVAKSLSYNPICSQQILQEGVGLWVNKKLDLHKEIEIPTNIDECVRMLYDKSSDADKKYLEQAKEVLVSINQLDAANSLNKRISLLVDKVEPDSESETTKHVNEVEWEVIHKETFTDIDFQKWITENWRSATVHDAVYAGILLRRDFFAMVFLGKEAKVLNHRDIPGQCVVANRYYFPDEIYNDNFIIYNLLTNNYEIEIGKFMEKKEFDSFERLGKQLDALVNNLGAITKPTRVVKKSEKREKSDCIEQLTQVFSTANYFSLESEKCDVANFVSIQEWITSKLPVQGASKAHIFRTELNGQTLVGIFFSDKEYNTLIGENYPMKRILCNQCDSDIEAFLNGLAIGTINI